MNLKAITIVVALASALAGASGGWAAAASPKTTTPVFRTEHAYLGDIDFQDQTITKDSAAMLHEQILLQRTTQLVTWAMPMMNFYTLYPALLGNTGMSEDDVFFGLYDGYDGVYPFMTANVTTPYTIAMSDLSKTGPVVLDLPAGEIYGVVNNAWMQPLKEIGSGKPETLLLVGPGQNVPRDFEGEVVQSDTFLVLYFYRALGTGDAAKKLRTAVQAYKLPEADNPPKTKFIKYEPKPGDKVELNTQPRDMRFWELVNEYVQREPMAERDRFFYAWLKDVGIEKGKAFKPSAKQRKVLQQALDVGMAMSQAISFNKTKEMFPTSLYRGDSGWEDAMAGMNPKIDLETYSQFNERASYSFEATTTSAGMVSRVSGKGSAYLGSYYDADGNALMGSMYYKLRVEPNPPAANFWSVTVYDIENRLIIRNETKRSGRSSRTPGLIKNRDRSVDLYFGPTAPAGKELNWIQTNEGESFFVYLRLYGPEQAYFDQAWPMNKIERVNPPAQRTKMTTDIPASITAPDQVSTSIGTLRYFDGVPTDATVETVYDYLDRSRAVNVFINSIPAMSMYALREGQASVGADACNKICIWDTLMDSTSLLLTGNTSTMYAVGFLDLDRDGPTVIDLPPGMLGILDDMAFHYMTDLGVAGPDKGKGGKFLVLPPGYEGDVADGYFVVPSKTNRVWVFMRGYLDKKLPLDEAIPAASANIRSNLRVYPLADRVQPPRMEFINVSGREMNTILPNDYTFFEKLHELIQGEPDDYLGPEAKGMMAAIGIEKGEPFNPDARMKRILTDAAAIGNAAARAISFFPREPGNLIYGEDSGWMMAYANKNTAFETNGAYNLDARALFHFGYICVSPAMAVTVAGKGSDYGLIALDSERRPLDGSKTYKIHLPPNVPVKDFWALTLYDTQTRSQLQTDQQFPTLGSQTEGVERNADGSYDIYFGPQPPKGKEGNWMQTIPGKSWWLALRMYGPLQPWLDKTWRPGEIELVR